MPRLHGKPFNETLFDLRKARGWSLRDAAIRIGIHHARLDELEKGLDNRTGRPAIASYVTVVKLARAYEIEPDELLKLAGYEPGIELSEQERHLIEKFRAMDEAGREALIRLLEVDGPEASA